MVADQVLQRLAVKELHGDEALALLLPDLVDGADIGVVQGRGGLGLAPEAFQCLRVLGHVIGQELEGNEATERRVLSLIHHTHPAAAQLLDDAVVRDGLADQ